VVLRNWLIIILKEETILPETRKSNRLVTIVVGLWIGVCVGAVVVGGLLFFGPALFDRVGMIGLKTDEPAPDFELVGVSGESVRLSSLRGQPVVVNYWATWCMPCVEEMSIFQKYHEQYPDKFVMIGVDEEEPAEEVHAFIEDFGLTYQVLLDTNTVAADAYQVMTLPSTFFIDGEGILRYRHIGILTETQFKNYLSDIGVFE
jgi:peroxiredoxin